MERTEGQISNKDFPSQLRIVRGTKETGPESGPTSVDSFGIENISKIPSLENDGRTKEPWAVERINRVRAIVVNRNDNDPKNAVFLVGSGQESRKFVVNKSLLMMSSQPFRKILENAPVQNNVYDITDVASKPFECIVQYLFGHFTWEFKTMEDTCSQIEAANTYQLKGLNDDLFERLTQLVNARKEIFNDDVVCRAWGLFTTLDTKDLLAKSARDYILQNAAKILRGNKFLEMSSEDLLEFLTADDLSVDSELEVYKALLKWGAHNLKERAEQITTENMRTILSSLIPAVRFPSMSKSEIRNYVLPLELTLPQQTEWLKSWCSSSIDNDNGGEDLFCSKVRWSYTVKGYESSNDASDVQIKLENAEADAYLAKYDRDSIKHNFNLDMLNLRREMAEQNLNVKDTLDHMNQVLIQTMREQNRANEEVLSLMQEEQNSTIKILNQTTEELNQTTKELSNTKKELHRTKECLNLTTEELHRTTQELYSQSHSSKLTLQNILDSQQSLLKTVWYSSYMWKEAKGFLVSAQKKLTGQKYVCTVVLTNNTSAQLTGPYKYFIRSLTSEYCQMPTELHPNTTRSFGFERDEGCVIGVFSYCIGDKRFLVRYSIGSSYNAFVLGFAPPNIPLNDDLFEDLRFRDWSKFTDKRKADAVTKDLTQDLKLTLEFGNLKAEASMIPGEKALLSIVLSEKSTA